MRLWIAAKRLLASLNPSLAIVRWIEAKTTDKHVNDLAIATKLYVSTVTGLILRADPEFCHVTGWRIEDLIRKPLDIVLPDTYKGRPIKGFHLQMIRSGLTDKGTREMTKKRSAIPVIGPDGKEHPASINITYEQKDTEWLAIAIITFQDRTGRSPIRPRRTIWKRLRDWMAIFALFVGALLVAFVLVEVFIRVAL